MINKANLGLAIAVILVVCGFSLANGLVAHWKLDGNATDSAGSNDGTPVNGPVWTTGKISGALEFDGVNDYVSLSNNVITTTEFTVSAWANQFGLGGGVMNLNPIFEQKEDLAGNNRCSILLMAERDNNVRVEIRSSIGSRQVLLYPRMNYNDWHHYTVTVDSNDLVLYINGVEVDRTANNQAGNYTTSIDYVDIGRCHSNRENKGFFNGVIDEVRIYNRALSAGEVYQLYGGELLGLEVVGPDKVAENSQAQYKAIAHYEMADVDVTDLADWSVEPNDIASIAAGLLTTEAIDLPLDLTIYAEYSKDGNTVEAEKDVSIFAICPSGSALDFDGINDYVEIADDDSLTPQSEITIAFWIYNRGGQSAGISKYASCPGDPASPGESRAYYLDVYNDNQIRLTVFATAGLYDYLLGNTTNIPLNQWHHIAGTFNAGEAKVYLNGNLDNSKTMSVSSIMNDVNPLMIGAHWAYCYGQPTLYPKLNGKIDEIAIYNRALSAEQIQLLMHTRPDGEPNLVGYWDFDEGNGQEAADSSGIGNDGTLGSGPGIDNSDPNWVDTVPPVGICSVEGIVERNLLNVLGMKNDVLDILDEAIGKEEALWEYMDTVFKDRDFGNTSKGDVVKAKQKILSAIQREEQAETSIGQSLEKLNDALDALDIELNSNGL